jgi:hypothetical protein
VETVEGLLNLLTEHKDVIISLSTPEDEEKLLVISIEFNDIRNILTFRTPPMGPIASMAR